MLKEFQEAMPHRIDLFASGARIMEAGFEQWSQEATDDYSCGKCGAINSAYDLECRKCGKEPSCAYVERNREAILRFLEARQA
jgi:ribosomal protein L40E